MVINLRQHFSSTGTPSFFIHPSEAMHGDIGAITKKDIVLLISNSGSTPEIVQILPNIKKIGCTILSLCGNSIQKFLMLQMFLLIQMSKKKACPLNLAPTSSTTVTLILGDIIAVILMKMKNLNLKILETTIQVES